MWKVGGFQKHIPECASCFLNTHSTYLHHHFSMITIMRISHPLHFYPNNQVMTTSYDQPVMKIVQRGNLLNISSTQIKTICRTSILGSLQPNAHANYNGSSHNNVLATNLPNTAHTPVTSTICHPQKQRGPLLTHGTLQLARCDTAQFEIHTRHEGWKINEETHQLHFHCCDTASCNQLFQPT